MDLFSINHWNEILSYTIKQQEHVDAEIKIMTDLLRSITYDIWNISIQTNNSDKIDRMITWDRLEVEDELKKLQDRKNALHEKICHLKYDRLGSIEYLNIVYNRFALFKIPTKEYIEYKLQWKINDYDKIVKRYTSDPPIFKEDGIFAIIESQIRNCKDWTHNICTQYATGEFNSNGKLDGIGFVIDDAGGFYEGTFQNGKLIMGDKKVHVDESYSDFFTDDDHSISALDVESDLQVKESKISVMHSFNKFDLPARYSPEWIQIYFMKLLNENKSICGNISNTLSFIASLIEISFVFPSHLRCINAFDRNVMWCLLNSLHLVSSSCKYKFNILGKSISLLSVLKVLANP